jgi:DNA-directed RNA polymerase subunit RPC12/RpoP
MRAPDLRAYHLACYDARAARPRRRPDDGATERHAMSNPVLPETNERRCPYCGYQRIAADGPVTVAQEMIKERLRCRVCGLRFVFVRRLRD